jgi:hypothetical protein
VKKEEIRSQRAELTPDAAVVEAASPETKKSRKRRSGPGGKKKVDEAG